MEDESKFNAIGVRVNAVLLARRLAEAYPTSSRPGGIVVSAFIENRCSGVSVYEDDTMAQFLATQVHWNAAVTATRAGEETSFIYGMRIEDIAYIEQVTGYTTEFTHAAVRRVLYHKLTAAGFRNGTGAHAPHAVMYVWRQAADCRKLAARLMLYKNSSTALARAKSILSGAGPVEMEMEMDPDDELM